MEGQAAQQRAVLQEKQRGLPSSSGSPEQGCLSIVLGGGAEAAAGRGRGRTRRAESWRGRAGLGQQAEGLAAGSDSKDLHTVRGLLRRGCFYPKKIFIKGF